jgi:N-acetyl-anhydromuramyl-L-alanine amidase AmpD
MQGAGKINGAGRTNRSTTVDGSTITNATTSYANKLFVGSGLWPSAPVGSGVPQRSSFAASTLRDRGWIKGIFYGLNYSDLNNDVPDEIQTQYIDKYVEMYPTTYGASFDYWGVYNNDSFLRTTKPQSLPFNSRRVYYEKNTFSSDTPINNSEGAWTSWWYEFSENGDNSPGAFSDLTIADDIGDETEDGSFSDPEPLWNQMRSAKEAAAHSYMPMLWVAPWQHFYTEAVSIDGSRSARKSGAAPTQGAYGTWVEQVLTFIPMDTPYRDYVGNFGLLGNENNNYSSRKVGAQTISLNLPIAASFTRKTFDGYYNGDKTVSQLLTSFYIKKGDEDSNTIKNSYMMTLEGGKYADLMAILPTFVKEKFVEEFEEWCDGIWKTKYLSVIDPVNFGWEVSPSSTNVPAPLAPYLEQGEHSYAEIDLLGKSYRAKPFNGIAKWPLSDIIGTYMGDEWTDSAESAIGFNHYCSLIALDKGNSENGKNGTIAELEKSLISEYYYAMISTPRLFGLDHPNGDYGGYNSDGSDYQYWDATSRPAYSNNAFYANKKLAKVYLDAFQEEWKEYYQTKFSQLTDEEGQNDNGSILEDDDIKLSLYRSFKSIVDKWISSTRRAKTGEKKLFFNITQNENDAAFDKSTTPLAGHFSYVNRVMGEIGNKAVLDVIKLDQIPENPKKSFYHTISDLLGENKFDFFPLPSFTNFTNNNRDKDINKTAREMFEPYTGTIVKASGPQFICMYVGGTSRMVDLRTKGGNCKIDQEDLSFNDDGFEISDETDGQRPPEYAKPMSEEPLAPFNPQYNYKDPTRIEGNGFTAFRVAYGIENQNMFKNIELDQTEFSETNESLMVIDRLAKGGDPADRTQKGNNLHNVYLTRGYTAKVESLGNMTIQPLQYFELTNIPMFYGTYLITEVSHNIKPNHITTNFKGTRQPIATVPVVEDVATAMNQSLQKIDPSGKKRNALNGGFDAGGGPGDGCYNPNSTNNTITNNVPNNVVEGIPFIDVGKDDPSKYYNHAWKVCDKCDRNKPGQLNKSYKKDGTVKETWWVAYNQPTSNLDPNKVEYIGLHWTGGYSKVKDSGTLKFRGLHYTFEIDKDGTLYQVSDLNKIAYHGGNMNSYSIGISYVGGTEDNKSGSVYVRTINDWNQEDLNLNGRDTYKAKKQFASIVDACTLAVKKYPNIKYITSHHFWSGSKSDVGNKFPYDILIAELKKRGINLTVKYSGDAPGKVKWTGKQQETVSGTISDLSYDRDAIQQETDGNEPEDDNNNVATNNNSTLGTAVAGNINRPKNVNEALQSAGQI